VTAISDVVNKKEAIKSVLLKANNAIKAIDAAITVIQTSNNNVNKIDTGKQLLKEGTSQALNAALEAKSLFPFSESSPDASLNVHAHNMHVDANQMVTHVDAMKSFQTLTDLEPNMLQYIASFEHFIEDTQHALSHTVSGGRRTRSLRKNRRTHSKGKRTKRSKHTKRKRSKHTKRKNTK